MYSHRRTLSVGLVILLCLAIANAQGPVWRPTPQNPIVVDKPNNFTFTTEAECPKDCSSNGCCTGSWDMVSWLMQTMPQANCSYCQALRYAMGRLGESEEVKCEACLMDDFKNAVSQFQCPNDNGRCTKCCMDLTLIYISRFIYGCPSRLNREVVSFKYKNTGFMYDGSSSCPTPSPSPSPSPVPGEPLQFSTAEELFNQLWGPADAPKAAVEDPNMYDYMSQTNFGLPTEELDLLTPSQVLEEQREAGIIP